MPFTEKQEHFFRARAHGWVPSNPKLKHLTQGEAKRLVSEAQRTQAKRAGQAKAIREA